MQSTLELSQGKFHLHRLPKTQNDPLQAWDAADEYLLNHLFEHNTLQPDSNILILNDTFGALSVVLSEFSPIAASDSWLSHQATLYNLQANHLNMETVSLHSCLEIPILSYDFVLIKVPKTLALFEYELLQLRSMVKPDCQIILAGMIKSLPKSVWKLTERILGPTSTSLAKKKSRLIFVKPDNTLAEAINPYPEYYTLENTDYTIYNHANVFSRDHLDIGTRFFLQHLPLIPDAKNIIDLGCGNGILGIMTARQHPDAHIYFVDESYMAIASARQNFQAAFSCHRQADFCLADGLTDFADNHADLILCNPPFHQQHAVADHIAQQMFKDAFRSLQTGGELWVIGNRHLAYHNALKRHFKQISQVACNAKFVVFKCAK